MCSEQKVTGQCTIEHYLSATKVQQILERNIHQEGEQDNLVTEQFGDTDLRQFSNRFETTKTCF